MKRICIAAALMLFFGGGIVAGQTAALIDQVLSEERLSYGSAAMLLLGVTGQLGEGSTASEAVETLAEINVGLDEAESDSPVNLGELSLLIVRMFDVDAGFMYALMPGPRYAARELEFRGVIQGNAFPDMSVDGERGLRIVNRAVVLEREGQL